MANVERSIHDLVLVGFNSRVVALDRYTGEIVWEWKSPEGSGYVSVLVDGDRIIASVMGYTYCIDPVFGQTVWSNPLRGMGTGVACLASGQASTGAGAAMAAAQQQAAAASATAAAAAATTAAATG